MWSVVCAGTRPECAANPMAISWFRFTVICHVIRTRSTHYCPSKAHAALNNCSLIQRQRTAHQIRSNRYKMHPIRAPALKGKPIILITSRLNVTCRVFAMVTRWICIYLYVAATANQADKLQRNAHARHIHHRDNSNSNGDVRDAEYSHPYQTLIIKY